MAEDRRPIDPNPERYYATVPNRSALPQTVKMEWEWAKSQADQRLQMGDMIPESVCVLAHPGGATPMHRHDFFELIYVCRGTADNVIAGKKQTLMPGDMCLMNTNALHSLDAGPDAIVFNLVINRDVLESSISSLIRSNDLVASFFAQSIHGIYTSEDYILFPAEGNEEAQQILGFIIREYNERDLYHTAVVQAQLVWLLASLSRSFQKIQLRSESGAYGPTIAAIIEYISVHCATATLESTATHFHYNASYFSRMLKRITHTNFSDILQRFRLEKAADLLRTTGLQIRDIADQTGFRNSNYFSTAFRRAYGQSPGEYRKNQKG